jgi:hypothetical protein
LGELWGGIPQLRQADRLANDVRADVDPLRLKLGAVRTALCGARGVAACFTGTDRLREPTAEWVAGLVRELGLNSTPLPAPAAPVACPSGGALTEGLVAAADVGYSAFCMPAPHASHPDAPLLSVFCQMLTFDYPCQAGRLWRVRGLRRDRRGF